MPEPRPIAIADYGMGNLFSVLQACAAVGIPAAVTTAPRDLLAAPAVILPGVGAMPDAMRALAATGLDEALREAVARGTPLLGVCLGLQLLMTEGTEFTRHAGLGLVEGDVVRLEADDEVTGRPLRVPHIGWNAVRKARAGAWRGTALETLTEPASMYFIHSFHVRPADPSVAIAETDYGMRTFCSAVAQGPIVACQFHPERSGAAGLEIYRRFAAHAGLLPDLIETTSA